MKKIRFTLTILFMFLIFVSSSIFALAADAEYRMMHGEQDAIVVGTIKEVSEDVVMKGDNEAISISNIGGADGPTSIFIAGKLGGGFVATVVVGVVLLVAVIVAVVVVVKKKSRK